MRKKDPEKKTGASRMYQLGYKQVQVWLDENEYEAAKKRFGRNPLAAMLRRLLCEACNIRFVYR